MNEQTAARSRFSLIRAISIVSGTIWGHDVSDVTYVYKYSSIPLLAASLRHGIIA